MHTTAAHDHAGRAAPWPYAPSWNSLKRYQTPRWFQEAKFGIYTHWGLYCVPARGPNATWYPYNMYREGTPQHAYHVQTYGDPSKFGYKDFIPLFTAEKFDPDEWEISVEDPSKKPPRPRKPKAQTPPGQSDLF